MKIFSHPVTQLLHGQDALPPSFSNTAACSVALHFKVEAVESQDLYVACDVLIRMRAAKSYFKPKVWSFGAAVAQQVEQVG